MPTYPSVDITTMELSPMQVSFKGPSDVDYADLGGTLDNVVISSKYSKAEIKADQFGDTVLNRVVSGFNMTVTTSFAQILDKDLLKILFPSGVLAGSGDKYFTFVTNVGDSDRANAGQLKLHPQNFGPSDTNFDWNFPVACASADSEFTFGPTAQTKAKIVFNIYPNLNVTPAIFATIGDTSL